MNEISIIINGVRYDAVIANTHCDLAKECDTCSLFTPDGCCRFIGVSRVFKVSTKSFER